MEGREGGREVGRVRPISEAPTSQMLAGPSPKSLFVYTRTNAQRIVHNLTHLHLILQLLSDRLPLLLGHVRRLRVRAAAAHLRVSAE